MNNKVYKFEDYLIEGLIVSQEINLVIKKLEKELKNIEIVNSIKMENNTFKMEIDNFDIVPIDKLLVVIDKLLYNNLGWFISSMFVVTHNGMDNLIKYDDTILQSKYKLYKSVTFKFEAKFDKKSFIPPVLYHVSPNVYQDKILSKGLIPKSLNKLSNHPERIYLTDDLSFCDKLIIKIKYISMEYFNKKYNIYQINTNGLDIKLYHDPNSYENGVYTFDNIPPNKIQLIKKDV